MGQFNMELFVAESLNAWDGYSTVPIYGDRDEPGFSNWIELLGYRAAIQAEKVAYTFLRNGTEEVNKLTYAQLEQQAQSIAAYLQSLGLVGESALLIYPPGLEFIAAFFGCLYAGVVAVPAYPPRRNQNMSRLEAILADAGSKVVLTSASLLETIQSRIEHNSKLQTLPWLATDNLPPELATTWQEPSVNPETLAFLQYTSGSTGNPKGVMITHANLLHNSSVIRRRFGVSQHSHGIIWLPPYHDMGLIGGVLQATYSGASVALMSPMDFLQKPLRWLQAISHYGASTSGGPNFAYDLCVQKTTPEQREGLDLSSWEVAFTGAEPIRAETLEQFTVAFAPHGFRAEAFYPCYGMAETTLMVTGGAKQAAPIVAVVESEALEQNHVVLASADQSGSRCLVGCGQALPEQQLQIVDPATLKPCSENQVGEIWVASASVAQGYWNRSEETVQTFKAYLTDTQEGPFLRTGDLGFVRQGELYITGRLKEVLIIRGQNHYPQDIEFTVQHSHPALVPNGGAVFTVEGKGSEHLIVVQEVKRTFLRNLDIDQLVSKVRQVVALQHGLQVHTTVLIKPGTIPKTSSGKIRRLACRDAFMRHTLAVIGDWSQNPEETYQFRQLQSEVALLLETLKTPGNKS